MNLSYLSLLPLLAVVLGRPGTLELLPDDVGLGLPGVLSGLPPTPTMVRETLLQSVCLSALLGPGEQGGVGVWRDVETKFSL